MRVKLRNTVKNTESVYLCDSINGIRQILQNVVNNINSKIKLYHSYKDSSEMCPQELFNIRHEITSSLMYYSTILDTSDNIHFSMENVEFIDLTPYSGKELYAKLTDLSFADRAVQFEYIREDIVKYILETPEYKVDRVIIGSSYSYIVLNAFPDTQINAMYFSFEKGGLPCNIFNDPEYNDYLEYEKEFMI